MALYYSVISRNWAQFLDLSACGPFLSSSLCLCHTHKQCFSPDPHSSYFKFMFIYQKTKKPEPEILIKKIRVVCVFLFKKKVFLHHISSLAQLNFSIALIRCPVVFFLASCAPACTKWNGPPWSNKFNVYKHTCKRNNSRNDNTIEKNGFNIFAHIPNWQCK